MLADEVPIPIFAVSFACSLPLSVQRHVKFHCNLKAQLFSAQQNTASATDRRERRADSSPLSAKIGSQRYCLLVFSPLPVLRHSRDHIISSDHVCVTNPPSENPHLMILVAFLGRTPTRKRFPHSAPYEYLNAFLRHARVYFVPTRSLPMIKVKPPKQWHV